MSMRLKLLRKKLGVTLETLADKTGLTKSYLSKVERGLNTPSIAAALKLAKALNVQVEEPVLRGKRRCRRLQHRSSRPAQVAVQRRRRPGLRLPRAADRRPRAVAVHRPPPRDFSHSTFKEHLGEEFIFVHEGQVEVDFMNQRIILERGDALHFNAQKPHRIRSLGETQAELLVVIHSDE